VFGYALNVTIGITMDGARGGGFPGRLLVQCHSHNDAKANQCKQRGQKGSADDPIVTHDP